MQSPKRESVDSQLGRRVYVLSAAAPNTLLQTTVGAPLLASPCWFNDKLLVGQSYNPLLWALAVV